MATQKEEMMSSFSSSFSIAHCKGFKKNLKLIKTNKKG
jgi:hypothetical protein